MPDGTTTSLPLEAERQLAKALASGRYLIQVAFLDPDPLDPLAPLQHYVHTREFPTADFPDVFRLFRDWLSREHRAVEAAKAAPSQAVQMTPSPVEATAPAESS